MSDDSQRYAAEATGCFGKKGPCEVTIRVRSERERLIRAAKAWGLGWCLMIVSVFIPIAHWILVPSFFFIGPILGFSVYGQDRYLVRGSGPCPECGTPLAIRPASIKGDIYGFCDHCRAYVHIGIPAPHANP